MIKLLVIARILHSGLLLLITSLMLPSALQAQLKFNTVASSQEMGIREYVQIDFVVENAKQIDRLTPPNFKDFRIIQGPIQSSGMSIVNGLMSQYKSVSFVLQPVKTGNFTIAGASALVDGKAMRSNSVSIKVGKNNVNPSSAPPAVNPSPWPDESADVNRDYVIKPGENIAEKIKKNLFVKVQVSKTTCYVGEPIVATYKLYSRLRSESRVVKHPSLNGFSVYDMVDPNNDPATVENVNGKSFTVHIIRQAQLIPLQAGTIDLDGVQVDNTVHFVKATSGKSVKHHNGLQDLFDSFGDDETEGEPVDQEVSLNSKPVSISVKPLPAENKPADFSGAVGEYTISASVAKSKMHAKDAGTLTVTIRGKGNLPVISSPAVKWPKGIETYDATQKEDLDKTKAPLAGTKTFEYVFIPKDSGSYEIPQLSLSYFDYSSGTYKTAQSNPVDLLVDEGGKNSPTKINSNSAFANTANALNDTGFFLQKHLEWFFAILILSGLAIYLWFQNRQLRNAGNTRDAIPEAKQNPILPESATQVFPVKKDYLQTARRFYERTDYRGFYSELNRTIWNRLAEILPIPASELNKYRISHALAQRGWDSEKLGLLENTLNDCERKLYTPDYRESDMLQALASAEKLMDEFEHTSAV